MRKGQRQRTDATHLRKDPGVIIAIPRRDAEDLRALAYRLGGPRDWPRGAVDRLDTALELVGVKQYGDMVDTGTVGGIFLTYKTRGEE